MIDRTTSFAESAKPTADDQGVIPTFPPRQLDDRGRLVPLSAEEGRARAEAALRALKALDSIGDDADHRDALEAIQTGRELGSS